MLKYLIILSKIFDLSKKFALPDTLLKFKKKLLYRPRKCQGCYILLCSPGRKIQNLLLITQLNVIGTVFNFKAIGKVLGYTSSIWFGKLFVHVSFVVVTG